MIKFGTDGWRDVMYDRFTLEPVRRVAAAIADHVNKHGGAERGLVIGYDARFFSDVFAREAASTLAGAGIRVFTTGRDLPTPVIAFAVRHFGAFGALMFTASHNPPEYNGIKFIPAYAGPATPDITAEIEEFLRRRENGADDSVEPFPSRGIGRNLSAEIDPVPPYLAHLAGLVDRETLARSGLTLIYDPMHASGRDLLNAFFAGFCRFESVNGDRDPLFGGRMPDPRAENLGFLRERVRSTPCAIGLATDGDADRFGIIDQDGKAITPNQVLCLLLVHLFRNRGWRGIAVRTVSTTHLLDRIGAGLGVMVRETPVGFKYIGQLMREQQVIIGGEESGGLSVFGHVPEKDGLLACALMAELRAMDGRYFRVMLEELHKAYGPAFSRRLDLHLAPAEKDRLIESFAIDPPMRVLGREVVEINRVDGLKFLLADGAWFLLRPSGTESLVRIYAEAADGDDLEHLISWLESAVERRRASLPSAGYRGKVIAGRETR